MTIRKGIEAVIEKVVLQALPLPKFGTDGTAGMSASQIFLALSRGQIYNPNVELLYRGTGLRQFGFTYTFVPKSEQEATEVNRDHPGVQALECSDEKRMVCLRSPRHGRVRYMTGGEQNRNMNAFKPAALTSVAVSHNPGLDMHATFPNGMPIVTSMTLAFQETLDIILREDHDNSGSDIGF